MVRPAKRISRSPEDIRPRGHLEAYAWDEWIPTQTLTSINVAGTPRARIKNGIAEFCKERNISKKCLLRWVKDRLDGRQSRGVSGVHPLVPEHVESKIMDWCRWRESNLLPVGRDIIDIIDVVQSIYSNSLENEEEWALQAQPVFGYTGPNGGWYRNFCEQAKEEPHACGLSLVGLTI